MSHNIQELAAALAQGAEAVAKLPELEVELVRQKSTISQYEMTINDLHAEIAKLKSQIDTQSNTIRALEVARDDAGFRELEATEKLENLLRVVGGAVRTLETEVKSAKPSEPAGPIISTEAEAAGPIGHEESSGAFASESTVSSKSNEDALGPFVVVGGSDGTVDGLDADTLTSGGSKPYLGQHPNNKPWGLSWEDWEAGGGRSWIDVNHA